ncbi:mitochondrial 54S ribosomal protein bL17m MRPL8 PWA37_004385 [Arxiozyma heterogenica]|uniref:Large ribosomal subunit protein bL17m C-terminal fungi domain-containing protein n=1 Tax=Arxiozyma heterogenica TaxID=278026 RepID=A0AAN8A6V7_9SACH|nr:hypothetical protein RI543_003398 [Kazachstania heterogenica]
MTVGLARKLSRTKSHRDALLRNLVSQLFQHESIITTYEKCKETSRLAERIITAAKKYNHGNGSNRYIQNIQSNLFLSGDNKHLLAKVVNELADRFKDRNGGFTRILKLEPRIGDKSKQATIELVDTPIIINNSENITMQRGNIKFWLLMKTLLYNEINNESYSPLTMKNLLKIYKSKHDDLHKLKLFKEEMICVRKLLMEQMNRSDLKNDPKNRSFDLDQIKDSKHVDSILSQLSDMLSSPKNGTTDVQMISKYNNINRKRKDGYQIMSARPEGKEQQF